MFTVRFTADAITEESAAEGHAEESGWMDPDYSKRDMFPDREDVTAYPFETRDEAEAFILDTIGETESSDGENYYGTDPDVDLINAIFYTYAGHIEEG